MTLRIAITGAGGPSAVALLNALAGDDVELLAGDIDPYAPGLYLVESRHRWILHRGDDPRFVDDLLSRCIGEHADVLIPTVDSELMPLATRAVDFERRGVRVLLASQRTLALCLDKATLMSHCEGVCPLPRTVILDEATEVDRWAGPCVVKPRRGSGGCGVQTLDDGRRIPPDVPRDRSYLLQQFLPGEEYSVDTLCTPRGEIVATVPRSRLKIDSGIAVTGRTLHDDALQRQAAAVATHLGITFAANIQFRRDESGVARLLEVNARFPGTMPLTIASGVNMPQLALDMLLGRPIASDAGEFRDIGMVRAWQERFVAIGDIAALERQAMDGESPPRARYTA